MNLKELVLNLQELFRILIKDHDCTYVTSRAYQKSNGSGSVNVRTFTAD